ncbi:uncharacterized protein EI90DRAFT_3128357 [Cantharellus anzutake]|uniref:uncharacterized protein n=1 Tax=Cantharellus anzutake TaxID=1750568 RepID=UPI001904141B|nr:uncharacterized protein EI90DRAFT_3128357 [Cantharellus anzutake]KAF8325840.1 hypothetical protein EI90DRAFT_3128357 [Cantharellus anzutake]
MQSVVQSTFDNPCTRSGFDSGIHTGPFTYNYTVDDTDPYWLFCIVDGHCKAGMVAAINPPTSGNQTFAAFVAKAEGTTLPSTSQGSTSNPSTRTGSSATSTGGAVSTGTPGTSHSSSPSTTSRGGSASRTVPMAGIANIGAGALVASVLMIVGAVVVL